jgi:general stress protein CsbA
MGEEGKSGKGLWGIISFVGLAIIAIILLRFVFKIFFGLIYWIILIGVGALIAGYAVRRLKGKKDDEGG